MAQTRKKKKTTRRRFVYLVLLLLAGVVVFWGRYDLLWGLKGYLLDEIDLLRIETRPDLPPGSEARGRPAEVVGVPDYKHSLRFPYEGKTLTCYRMVDFGNRLCVCTSKGLKRPQAIDEIIKVRSIRGRLESLTKNQRNNSLRRTFLQAGGIRLAEDAFLLYEDPTPLPSKVRIGFFVFCAVLCCFSAYRLIK